MARPEDMWQCQTVNCGYIYNPDKGDRKGKIPPGVRFEDRLRTGNVLSADPESISSRGFQSPHREITIPLFVSEQGLRY